MSSPFYKIVQPKPKRKEKPKPTPKEYKWKKTPIGRREGYLAVVDNRAQMVDIAQERLEQACRDAHRAGCTLSDIAKQAGVAQSTIKRWLS